MTQFLTGMVRLAAVAALAGVCAVEAGAATLYWDGNGDGTLGEGGTWSTSGHNGSPSGQWSISSTSPGNPGPYGDWDQAGGQDIAEFRNTNGTVTISGTVSANRVTLRNTTASPTWLIQGGTLNMTGSSPTIWSDGAPARNASLNSNITGSNGLTFDNGLLWLGGTNTYNGNTSLTGAAPYILLTTNASLPSTTIVDINATGILRLWNSVSATCAGVTGSGELRGQNTSCILTVSRNDGGTSNFSGTVRNNTALQLVKQGNFTQVLSGVNANVQLFKATVSGGTLALAKTAGFNAVTYGATFPTTITVSGGQLRLDAANQIDDVATMALSGGTFNANGVSESLGALTLTASSVIDFGSGASVLSFASLTRTGGVLSVSGWTGTGSGGGTDQLRFTSDPSALLPYIQFTSAPGVAPFVRNFGSYYEVVIPEPTSLALLGVAGLLGLRRDSRARAKL